MNYVHRHRSLRLDGWEVARYYTLSGSLSYAFDKRSRLGDLRVTLGLENILNKEPPLDYAGVGYNQGLVGRPGGRFGYVAVRRSF
jgi:outer membrane receptor protein involved in Fe transport